jgi:hypothetical protein
MECKKKNINSHYDRPTNDQTGFVNIALVHNGQQLFKGLLFGANSNSVSHAL